MTSAEFRAAMRALFGQYDDPVAAMAFHMSIDARAVALMARGKSGISNNLADKLRRMVVPATSAQEIGPPPDGLTPRLDVLKAEAMATGLWTEPQVDEAVVDWMNGRGGKEGGDGW